jgi:hypothetical protein
MVKLWDVETGEEKVSLRPRSGPVVGLTFAADGRTLAVATQSGRIHLLPAATPEEVTAYELRAHER